MAVGRVNPDGTMDAGSGTGGWATADPAYVATTVNVMALGPDGRVPLAGSARPTTRTYPTDLALVRFLALAPQVGSFDAAPNPAGVPGAATHARVPEPR